MEQGSASAAGSDVLVTPEALAMVGHQRPASSERIESGAVRRWGRAVMFGDVAWREGDAVPTSFFLGLAKGMMGPVAAAGGIDAAEDQLYWLPPLRSRRTFNGGDRIEVHAPLRVGDVVTRRSRLEDVIERRTRDGRLRAFVTSRTTYTVDGGRRITWLNNTITVPEDEETSRPSDLGQQGEPHRPAGEEPPDSEVPSWTPPPLAADVDVIDICRFAGVNEELALQHVDKDYARERLGLPTVTVMGWLKLGLMGTLIDRWAGPGAVHRLAAQYRGVDFAGDRLTVTPVGGDRRDGAATVRLQVTNQRGERTTEGSARVHVPAA